MFSFYSVPSVKCLVVNCDSTLFVQLARYYYTVMIWHNKIKMWMAAATNENRQTTNLPNLNMLYIKNAAIEMREYINICCVYSFVAGIWWWRLSGQKYFTEPSKRCSSCWTNSFAFFFGEKKIRLEYYGYYDKPNYWTPRSPREKIMIVRTMEYVQFESMSTIIRVEKKIISLKGFIKQIAESFYIHDHDVAKWFLFPTKDCEW